MWYMYDGAPAHFSPVVRDVHLSWPMDNCMASTLARFESSAFLPAGTPRNPCVCSSCW
jgi:hypothetical protein